MPLVTSCTPNRPPRGLTTQLLCIAATSIALRLTTAAAAPPAAPLTFDTTYSAPSGKTISVAAGADFQAALNSAQLGDTIALQAGATYTGPFTLPNKTAGSGWIYVTSSGYAKLPAPGHRVSPSDAVNMPKVVSPPYSNAVVTVANSHHFRFVGIEFTTVPGAYVYNLITIGNQDASTATLANHIVFDRCYIHADANVDNRRGIEMDGAYVAVIDSYVTNFREVGADSQGLAAWNTSGPIKLAGNYIEGAGENVLVGGADSSAPSLVPADIEVSNNYFFKPLSLIGSRYVVKNLFELKSAKRVMVSGNTFQNNPAAGQAGFALLVTPRNQDGKAPWSVTSDITIAGNTFINVGSGINILGTDNLNPSQKTERVAIHDNVIGVTGLNGAGARAFMVLCGGSDITIDHNTVLNSASPSTASDLVMSDGEGCPPGTVPTNNFVFTNNLSTTTAYGFFASGVGTGNAALNANFTNWTFQKNALVAENGARYPSGNFFPANLAAVQFKSYAGGAYTGGDYTLAGSSPYKNAGTDGRDLGANLAAPALISSGAVVPGPPTYVTVK